MRYHSQNPTETKDIAHRIMSSLSGGTILCLHGNLGAGKTTFVKGVAEALGVTKEITSPTFTLMNVYELSTNHTQIKELIHIDTYRLEGEQELIDIGAEDYVGQPDTLTIVEWPEKLDHILKNKSIVSITIEPGNNPNERVITVN
jgi:tRNA threonylcarbamoyladenosine biosynthesis protein TsaE